MLSNQIVVEQEKIVLIMKYLHELDAYSVSKICIFYSKDSFRQFRYHTKSFRIQLKSNEKGGLSMNRIWIVALPSHLTPISLFCISSSALDACIFQLVSSLGNMSLNHKRIQMNEANSRPLPWKQVQPLEFYFN